jgi:hypothetical protein
MKLDGRRVPGEFAALLPIAEKWGIGDDHDRERAVSMASAQELRELVASLELVDVDAFFEWLAGPEAEKPDPSDEYLALICLSMAVESAKAKLEGLRN